MKRAGKTDINQQGFTIIEVVVVLIVLAIVTTVIVYRPTMGSNEITVQAEILKSHLRYAQIKAMNDTVPWGIHIPDANSYILYKNNLMATGSNILPGETAQTHALPSVVTITGGAGSTYNFNAFGKPVDTGGNEIASAQTITLSQGATTSDITITKNTGYIP
ncbi:MAG: hypothetical protein BWK74_04155 [Desulfobacteraceae bacterium A6]|nr:MAG: hypothetical protein BWK74_04155 [Desulfobacteraceae bacterium A6]